MHLSAIVVHYMPVPLCVLAFPYLAQTCRHVSSVTVQLLNLFKLRKHCDSLGTQQSQQLASSYYNLRSVARLT